jgi:hypothetical protein
MTKMKKEGIKIFIVALASFLMLVFCIVAASPDSSLRFIDPTPVNYTQEQDFTWGVLAINTHKSIYLPNEAAFVGIAVLDNEGHMVCDADVTLTITDPSNIETVLSTGNGLIKVSPQCCVYGVTNLPDYYTNYTVGGAGTYVMNLTVTAVTANGTKSITDEFSVQNSVDFDVTRDGPTRIYPPVPYVMNFTIKAKKNYTGLIREYVPASFDITPQDGLTVTTVGDISKILTWTKNLVEGETYNIYYEFDAPDVSPYLFTLGALEIGSFKEVRQWQIANDATVTYYFDAYNAGEAWLHDPEYMVDDILENYASCKVDQKNEWLTRNTCPGTDLGTISKVEIRAYGYILRVEDYVNLRPVFTGGDGSEHDAELPLTEPNAGWGSYIDITTDGIHAPSSWTWLNVQNLDCDALCHHPHGQTKLNYVAKVEIRVTYTPPTWASDRESYESPYHIVTMTGDYFALDYEYKVAYYDNSDNHVQTEVNQSDGNGDLESKYNFRTHSGAAPGNSWHSAVYDNTDDPPSIYNPSDPNMIIAGTFEVLASAIPEFPTVIAAIAVCMLCAVAYVVMRRRAEKG